MPHDTDRDDHDMMALHSLQYLRLRCLEIAVQTNDPDSPIGTADVIGVAQTLLFYVTKGEVPQMLGAMTHEDVAAAFAGPEIDTGIDNRADLHLGDPSLHMPRRSDTVSTVEGREHAEQQDERVDGGTAAGS